ncbi:MAG: ABC transporter substrate-binding protein, partial [Acidobacteriota bacterium]
MAERQRVLRIGLLTPLEELDPRCVGEILTETACRQIFETPFQMKNHQGHAKPWLFATPFSQRSGDGEPAVQAIVRSDVVFSDGLPMTAGDVATCLREDPQLGCHTIRADGERLVIEGVSDPREIEVALCQTRTAVWRSTPVGLVGTGPFRLCRPRGLHEQVGQETVELEPNPCYPRTPELDRICFEVFPPDGDGVPTALEAALRDGSVDLAFGIGKARADGLSGFVRQCTPGLSIALLFFNTARPPFDQQRLRLAVAKVLDRSQLAHQLYERPFAFVATSLLPPELGRYWDKL